MARSYRSLSCWLMLVLIVTLGGWGSLAAEEIAGQGQELTVYNDNLALVKDRRVLELAAGISKLSFTDVAALIDPTSVKFRSLTAPTVKVLEQNYEYDVVGEAKLLQKYLGQKIRVTTVKGDLNEGYLLGSGENLILGSQPEGGEVKIIKTSQILLISFPELPGGLVIRPTLVWLVTNPSKPGAQQVELTYLTTGLSWSADYVATINSNDDRIDLTGWVTLNNKSGAEYREARLKLVAGEINRAPEEERQRVGTYMMKEAAAPDSGFQEESFFEYHLYTLGRPTTIKNNQLKQVELLTASTIVAKKLFIYEGAQNPKKVKVMLEFKNSKENNLGIPLPKGRIRVQKADSEGSLQLIGEDRIDHTPKDEKVRLYLGNAFDIVGERLRTNVREPSKNIREETYQVTLRNHKKETVTVTVVEQLNRWNEWQIIGNDQPFTKIDAGRIEFSLTIPASGQATVNYTVRYKW